MTNPADFQNPYIFAEDDSPVSLRSRTAYEASLSRYQADREALIQALDTFLLSLRSGVLNPAFPDEVFANSSYVDKSMDSLIHGYVGDIQRLAHNLSVSLTRCSVTLPKSN